MSCHRYIGRYKIAALARLKRWLTGERIHGCITFEHHDFLLMRRVSSLSIPVDDVAKYLLTPSPKL